MAVLSVADHANGHAPPLCGVVHVCALALESAGAAAHMVAASTMTRMGLHRRLVRVGGAALMPSVDVSEDTAAITVTAELPGLTEKDVELTLDDGVLTLKGEKREEKTDATAHVTERRYGRFQRSFRLPDNADHPAIAARVDNGVLRVVIPKNPNAVPKARTIPNAGKT